MYSGTHKEKQSYIFFTIEKYKTDHQVYSLIHLLSSLGGSLKYLKADVNHAMNIIQQLWCTYIGGSLPYLNQRFIET